MGKGIDFSEFLTYTPPAPPPKERVDMSIWHKKNQGGSMFEFDQTISDIGIAVTEVEYRKAIPIVITDADINRWILGGAPMY